MLKNTWLWIFILYALVHILTLPFNPLPWFDETYYASIALNFIKEATFVPQVAFHARDGKEVLTYGPVYFFLTGLSFKLFDFGLIQFRIVNLLFGFFTIALFYKILTIITENRYQSSTLLVFTLAFALDPFLNLSMHEGRMDITSLFFILGAFYFILKRPLSEIPNKDFVLSGICIALSILTTPRAIVIIAGLFLVFVCQLILQKKWKSLLAWVMPVLVFYLIWVFYAFGGIADFINYYKELNEGKYAANVGFVGGRFYIPRHEYLLIIISILAFLFSLIKMGVRVITPRIIAYFVTIILYYIVVLDWGPYSVFILPLYYLILFESFSKVTLKVNLVFYAIIVLLLFNSSFWIIKNVQIISDIERRDYKMAEQWVSANIPPGSRVIGDPVYYYSVVRTGSEFQYYDKYNTLEYREQKHREEYDYDYMIISEQFLQTNQEAITYYTKASELEKIAEIRTRPSHLTDAINNLKIVSGSPFGYNAIIYKRVKEIKD
ncbi:MAG TPA: glycosyltransferase family 39 protein [Cytophagaceae bacterium]